MATFYSAYAIILYVLRGPQPFRESGATLQSALLAYYSAGLIGGLLVGILWPIADGLLGRLVMGMIVGLVFFGCIEVAVSGGAFWHWTRNSWEDVLVLGIGMGGAGGLLIGRVSGR